MVLLLTIVSIEQVGMKDIPSACKPGVYAGCLGEAMRAGLEYEPNYGSKSCGAQTVTCWRSNYNQFLYRVGDRPPSGWFGPLNVTYLNLPDVVSTSYEGSLVYCHCLLTHKYTKKLPTDDAAWRRETEYFCDAGNEVSFAGILMGGLIVGFLLMVLKGITAEVGNGTAVCQAH